MPGATRSTSASTRRNWQPWLNAGRLRLLTGPDYQGAVTAARFLDAMVPTVVCVNPIVEEHRPEAAAGARRVADIVQANAESNAIARRNFAGRYLLQTLTNLPVVAREGDAAALDGLFAGTPAVAVSLLLSAVALFIIGAGITLLTGRSVLYSGGRQVLFGIAAAGLTFGVGRLIGVSLAG